MKLHPIAKSIYDHPDKWCVGKDRAYPDSGHGSLSFWIARGFLFLDVPDTSLWEKYCIMKAVKWLRKKKMSEKIKELETM